MKVTILPPQLGAAQDRLYTMFSLAGSTVLAAGVPLAEWCDNDQVAIMEIWARVNTRRQLARAAYHPSESCKMGIDSDPMAVVDAQGRLHGLEALRVVDASLMPRVVSGNLNAPTTMMAEKLSDAILGRAPLPHSEAKIYIARNYETAQGDTERAALPQGRFGPI